jgi:hypothetical protein
VVTSKNRPEEPEMNTLTNNPAAASFVARQLIQERVQDAQQRSQARAVRADRRAARQAHQTRPVVPPSAHDLPWWTLRFLFPAH